MSYRIISLIGNSPQIDYVIIEDTVLQRSPATMKQLSQLQGVVIGYCIEHGIPYDVYHPTSWRKLLEFEQGKGTKREQLKQQSQQFVEDTYQISVSDDESDAICIGLAYIKKNFKNTEDKN